MDEVVTLLDIFEEAQLVSDLYINIPIAILDFKELILSN